jgi:glutamate formiminotransferase/formiminotetrahydrofolate cyclodeaminase
MKLVECVPNISEGRRRDVYEAIARAVADVPGVTLLDIDAGADTHRTVITFVGPPEPVLEGAFRLTQEALARIDMRHHQGAHPRLGAVDVVPFVPIREVTMEACVELARRLSERLGKELDLPVYLYEQAATAPHRRNLADIRAGEYEGLAEKLKEAQWQPDFGPARFVPQSGACVVGARKLLVAYNVNLNTTDKRLANRVAFDVREKGRKKLGPDGVPLAGENGEPQWEPGLLKAVKAAGWSIPQYGCAQVSMNLTDLEVTPLHVAFDTCDERARERGLRVTGSEIVGLVSKDVLLAAGRHYLARMGRSRGVPEAAVIATAIRSLGLSEVKPFDPRERIIEYRLGGAASLAWMPLGELLDELSTDSPVPGGGSVSALAGSLGAALASMVANLAHARRGFEARQERLEALAVRAQALKDELSARVDADRCAFEALLAAMRLPRDSPEQARSRELAVAEATREAALVPLGVLESCPEIIELCLTAASLGLAASRSDAGVGAQMARAAAAGAYQNVCTNLAGLPDREQAQELVGRADRALARVRELHARAERDILEALGAEACLGGPHE